MPASDAEGEISFRLRYRDDEAGGTGWLVLPLEVGRGYVLRLVPNLFAPRSAILAASLEELRARGLVARDIRDLKTRGRRNVLRHLRIEGQTVPDVEVRIDPGALFRGTDGYLGQDFFFHHFAVICFDTRTFVMTLRRDA